jgi:TfoX/Sxy family transcriptional regulator of competence genes
MHAKKRPSRERPLLVKVSEEMKAWSSALSAEVETWPQVSAKPMFGMAGIYRKQRIFAALPRTRAFGPGNSVAFKVEGAGKKLLAELEKDPHVTGTIMQATRWLTYELETDQDLHTALHWLSKAYELAK